MRFATKKGYSFFEVSSAIQKSIRRGDEKTALYFMVEMFNSGFDEYVWKRLKIIVSEDVGLAEPEMPAKINALYNFYETQKKKKADNKPERLFLTQAVVELCRCKKSRLIDWYVIKLWREHDQKRLDIPDIAFDMHNSKGRKMGRLLDHFYNEGSNLENFHPVEGEEDVKNEAYIVHKNATGKVLFDKYEYKNEGSADLFEQS